MSPILIPIIALMIPITVIIGNYILKIKKLNLEATSLNSKEVDQLLRHLKKLEKENSDLKERVQHIEAIVTDKSFKADAKLLEMKKEDDLLEQLAKLNQQIIEIKKNKR